VSDADPTEAPERGPAPAPGRARGPRPGHDASFGVLLAVLAGGLLGTLGRYEVGQAWPAAPGGFPAATFVINTSGAFVLGLVLSVILGRAGHPRHLRAFVGTGLLGGWTTYSTLAVEATTLLKGAHLAVAAAYLGTTLVAGLGAAVAGIALGRRGGAPVAVPIDPDLPEGSEGTG